VRISLYTTRRFGCSRGLCESLHYADEKLAFMIRDSKSTSEWSEYRSRRRAFFLIWLGGMPVTVLISVVLIKLFRSPVVFYFMGIAWLLSFGVAGIRLTLFRCPRCRRYFFFTGFSGNHFAQRCVHCGLPKWEETGLDQKRVGS